LRHNGAPAPKNSRHAPPGRLIIAAVFAAYPKQSGALVDLTPSLSETGQALRGGAIRQEK